MRGHNAQPLGPWVLRRPKPRMGAETAAQIRRMYAEGRLTQRQIADIMGISYASVKSICTGRRWAKSTKGETKCAH